MQAICMTLCTNTCTMFFSDIVGCRDSKIAMLSMRSVTSKNCWSASWTLAVDGCNELTQTRLLTLRKNFCSRSTRSETMAPISATLRRLEGKSTRPMAGRTPTNSCKEAE